MFTPKPLDMFRRREIDVYLIKVETEVDLGKGDLWPCCYGQILPLYNARLQ